MPLQYLAQRVTTAASSVSMRSMTSSSSFMIRHRGAMTTTMMSFRRSMSLSSSSSSCQNHDENEVLTAIRRYLHTHHSGGGGLEKNEPKIEYNTTDDEVQAENERFQRIFKQNREWVQTMTAQDDQYFRKLADNPQRPSFLFIGCSDSRVPANTITGLQSGELFVHRNIANQVVNSDMNVMSVMQFAVEELKVKHIIVCGHYGCGGVQAATQRRDHGLLENWLRNIRDVQRHHWEELQAIENEEQRLRRLVELNVTEQCLNVFKTGTVQRSLAKTRFPRLHGLVYDIGEGLLRELPINFAKYGRQYQGIYALYPDREKK